MLIFHIILAIVSLISIVLAFVVAEKYPEKKLTQGFLATVCGVCLLIAFVTT